MEEKKSKAERKRLIEIAKQKERKIENRQFERRDRSQKDKNFTKERKLERKEKIDKQNSNSQ
jgi:hypothetical protein